jgi:hypothetical protein
VRFQYERSSEEEENTTWKVEEEENTMWKIKNEEWIFYFILLSERCVDYIILINCVF